jgi:hypothetical protein
MLINQPFPHSPKNGHISPDMTQSNSHVYAISALTCNKKSTGFRHYSYFLSLLPPSIIKLPYMKGKKKINQGEINYE